MFGCLKRIDSTYSFRAHALFLLTIIVSSKHKAEHLEKEAKLTFFETVFRVAEKHLLNASVVDDATHQHELDLLVACTLRLINVCVSVIGSFLPHSSIIKRSWGLWRITLKLSSHNNLLFESIEFLTLILCTSSGHIDTTEVVAFISQISCSQSNSSFNGRLMFGLVKVIDALIVSDPEGSFKGGIHKVLYRLIDRAIGSLANLCQPGFFGLESKSDPSNEDSLSRNVIDAAEASLKKLAHLYCKGDPDTRAMPWFLFCRALCVSTRAHDDRPAAPPVSDDDGQKVSLSEGLTSNNVSSYRDYVAWCGRSAAVTAHEFGAIRTAVKSIALACAAEGLKEISRGSPMHADILLARQTTDKMLVSLNGDVNESTLFALPCYASLFVEDIISTCCSCATYTVDDVEMRRMQREALQCLATVVYLFKESLDPQSADCELILKQHMSQIMSAIRPCLSVRFHSQLVTAAGSLVCMLTQYRQLDDKVLLKRLIRPLFPSIAEIRAVESEAHEVNPLRTEVSEEFIVADQITELGLAARLYSLSYAEGAYSPEEDIQETIGAFFKRALNLLLIQWRDLLDCSLLVVHGNKAGLSSDHYQPAILRGTGLSKLVKSCLIHALPYTIVAYLCTGEVPIEDLPIVLSALTVTVTESGLSRMISPGEINTLKFSSLLGLIRLLKYQHANTVLNGDTWISIIRRLLNTVRINNFSSSEKLGYVSMLLQLATELAQQYFGDQCWDTLKLWLWLLHVNILNSLIPGLVSSVNQFEDPGILLNCFPIIDRFAVLPLSEVEPLPSKQSKLVYMRLSSCIISLASKTSEFHPYCVAVVLPILYYQALNTNPYTNDLGESVLLLVEYVIRDREADVVKSLRDMLLSDFLAWNEHFNSSLTRPGCLPYLIMELWYTVENKVLCRRHLCSLVMFFLGSVLTNRPF